MGCCERVGSARNLCPRWIAAKASSVSSCTADVGLDPSGECLLTPQTAPAVGQTTGKRFALPNVYTRSLLRPTPSTGAGPGSARERNTPPIGCPSLGGSDASAGVSRNAALGFHAGVVGSGASRSLVQTRRGPTSANRGPSRARSRGTGSGGQELAPPAALLTPVEGGGDRHQVSQEDGIAAPLRRRQKEQRFLDIRR